MTTVVLSTGKDQFELRFEKRPTQDQLCAIMASGLFTEVYVMVDGIPAFKIAGRVAEFGQLRWGLRS